MNMDGAIERALAFRDERNWKQFHNPKDLAISISLEASELLEVFQWSDSRDVVENKKTKLEEELADVLIYSIYLADAIDVDIPDIIIKKLKSNEAKYPIDKARDSAEKYTEL